MRPKQVLFHTYIEHKGKEYRTLDTAYPMWQRQNETRRWVPVRHFDTAECLTKKLREKNHENTSTPEN